MTTQEQHSSVCEMKTSEITRIASEAVALAIEEHRRLGNPIAVWRDGKVVWIPPEEIPPYTPPSAGAPSA